MQAVLFALGNEFSILLFCLLSRERHEFNQYADGIRMLAQVCCAGGESIVRTLRIGVADDQHWHDHFFFRRIVEDGLKLLREGDLQCAVSYFVNLIGDFLRDHWTQ